MPRVVLSLIVVPILLTALLAGAMELSSGRMGSVTMETFELGLLSIAMFAAMFLIMVFLPLLWVASRFVAVSWWSAAVTGLLTVLIPIVIGSWSSLTNGALRWNYRMKQLGSHYPWLILGVVGGLLFWLLAVFRNRAIGHGSP